MSNPPILGADGWHWVGVGMVLCLGLALRVLGLNAGLPLLYHEDEDLLLDHTKAINWGDLNPHCFTWGSLPFYILRLILCGVEILVPSITRHPLTTTDYFLVARIVSVAFNLATVFLAYVLGRLVAGRLVGLLTAGLMAVSPLAVVSAHMATIESYLGFWSTLALIGMVCWIHERPYGWWLAAVSAGLAIATKATALPLLAPIVLIALQKDPCPNKEPSRFSQRFLVVAAFAGVVSAVLVLVLRNQVIAYLSTWTHSGQLQPGYLRIGRSIVIAVVTLSGLGFLLVVGVKLRQRWARWAVSTLTNARAWKPLLIACLAFLVVSPFSILDFPGFAQGVFFNVRKQSEGPAASLEPDSRPYELLVSTSRPAGPFHYLGEIWRDWGTVTCLALLLGVVILWKEQRQTAWPLLAFVVLSLALVSPGRFARLRYLYAIWSLLALFSAIGFHSTLLLVRTRLPRYFSLHAATTCLILASPALLMPDVLRTIKQRYLIPDTRELASEWIVSNLSPEDALLGDLDAPNLEHISSDFHMLIVARPFEQRTLASWRECGVTVVIIGTGDQRLYEKHVDRFSDLTAEYGRIKASGTLLKTFEPNPTCKGPFLSIYRVN